MIEDSLNSEKLEIMQIHCMSLEIEGYDYRSARETIKDPLIMEL